jgi:starch phosphorylase
MQIKPSVFHMNEGHSAFLALERTRVLLEAKPELTFDEARQMVMAMNVFTTHTPVPAGIDMFPPDMVTKYFKDFIPQLKLDEEGFPRSGPRGRHEQETGLSPWRCWRSVWPTAPTA